MDDHTSRRCRLRSATHRLHERLDDVVATRGAVRRLDHYADLLHAMVGCHSWAEWHLRALPDLDRSGHRTKVAAALEDLAALGVSESRLLMRSAPSTELSRDQLLGMLYVIEGSTLGARRLADLVAQQLPSAPTAFLRCYGDDVARRWTRTVRFLDSSIVDDQHAASGARFTFERFLGALG